MEIKQLKFGIKNQKITYKELSELSGIPLNTLKNIFSGRTKHPRIDTVQAIERALGMSPTEDTTDNQRLQDMSEPIRQTITPDEEKILSVYREIGRKKGSDPQKLAQKILEQIRDN